MKKKRRIIYSIVVIIVLFLLIVRAKKTKVSDDAVPVDNIFDSQHISIEELLGGYNMAGLKVGDAAPDFSIKTNKGDTFTLSSQKGKKVVLTFFATW